jgi:hypothetical protein
MDTNTKTDTGSARELTCKKCGGRILNVMEAFCDKQGVYHEGCILGPEYYMARFAEGEALARMILQGQRSRNDSEEVMLEESRDRAHAAASVLADDGSDR